MLVKIEAGILIFPGMDFHFPSTSVPPGTFFKALIQPPDSRFAPQHDLTDPPLVVARLSLKHRLPC